MRAIKIVFETDEEICSFVRAANNCEGEVDVRYGSRVVDGKSVLGVLSFGLHKPLEIILHSEADQDFTEKLSALTEIQKADKEIKGTGLKEKLSARMETETADKNTKEKFS